MARKLFDELMDGVQAMQQQREGKITLRQENQEVPPLPDLIRDTREKLHLSRPVFARRLRIAPRTLENWEQGRSHRNHQAAALILLVRKYPDTLDKLASLVIARQGWKHLFVATRPGCQVCLWHGMI